MMTTKTEGIFKILGFVDESGGSNIGIVIPLKALNGKTIKIDEKDYIIECSFKQVPLGQKKLLEEDLIPYDCCFFHWLLENSASEIDLFSQRQRCMMVNFMDDYINENAHIWHPMYQTRKTPNGILEGKDICAHIKQRIILQAATADLMVSTRQPIINELSHYSDALHLSPNMIPYGEGQYELVDNKSSEDGLMGILCIGSSSHFQDYREIKNIIKKISDDSEVQQKAKWVIAGVIKGDKDWQKFVDLFSTNKKMKVEVVEAAPIDDYMKLYGFGNVCFQPLTKNFFNICKSSLRLAEASCHNLAVIGSDLYSDKELTGYLKCSSSKDYYSWIKYLIKNKNWIEIGQKLSEINRKESDFHKKIERLRQAIEIIANKPERKPKDLKIYSIIYHSSQFGEYEKYDNSHIRTLEQKSYLFEYNPIQEIIANKIEDLKDDSYLGIFSYKFPLKTQISSKLLYKLFEEQKGDSDVYGFSPSLKRWGVENKAFLRWTEYQHPGFMELFTKICERLGLEVKETDNVIYSNFMIMKKKFWVDYVTNYIKPAIKLMEGEFLELAVRDAKYQGGLSPDKLREVTGIDKYSFETFICERLINLYISQKGLKFKQII